MKILSVELARVIWLFNTADMNPTGRSLNRPLADIVARYKFKKFPANLSDSEGKGIVFSEGEFTTKSGLEVVVGVTLYNDGIVADTISSTEAATEFLHDLAQYLSTEQQLVFPAADEVKVGHFSRLVVRPSKDIADLDARLREFGVYLSSRV